MSSEMADLALAEGLEKMKKAVAHAKSEFSSIRTGRAAPALVERIVVDYYGSEVPMQQLAGFSVPEARQLMITPYDKGDMGDIERARRLVAEARADNPGLTMSFVLANEDFADQTVLATLLARLRQAGLPEPAETAVSPAGGAGAPGHGAPATGRSSG